MTLSDQSPQITTTFTFCVFLHILGTAEASIFKFCAQIDTSSVSLGITNYPQMGVVRVTWSIFTSLKIVHIGDEHEILWLGSTVHLYESSSYPMAVTVCNWITWAFVQVFCAAGPQNFMLICE